MPTQNQTLKSFAKSEDGTIAMIFALTASVCLLTTGLAIDLGRGMHANTKIVAAADAAALAAAKAMRDSGASVAQATAIAMQYFNENMKNGSSSFAKINGVNIQIDAATNGVTVDVDAEVPTVLGQLAGVQKFTAAHLSQAIYDTKDIEIGLQLDVTGSMRGRKLTDLKDAVAGHNGLLEIMLPAGGSTNKVRIGYAPFAGGVNAGSYAKAVSNNRAGADGCVYERHNLNDQTTEVMPLGPILSLRAKSELPPPPPRSSLQDCSPDAKVQPLTNDRGLLATTINSWNVSTSTAGHLGTAWAWYLISPEWSTIWPNAAKPAAYGEKNTHKIAILMTDGIYNTVGGASDGDHGATASQSTRIALDTCAAMKAKGVTVYTVGFEAPVDAKATLRNCASDPSKFYDATDGDKLRASFRAIANEINNLRLAR